MRTSSPQASRWLLALLLLGAGAPALLAPAPAYADDDDDEFETEWIGVRLGVWYRPAMNMNVQIGGAQGGVGSLLGTDLDIQRTLGVQESPYSEYGTDFDREAVVELEAYMHTRWISISLLVVPPFTYRGDKTLSTDVEFGGVPFTIGERVRSKFEQMWLAVDASINILNNDFIKLGPMVGIRALAIDWELEGDTLGKADSSDIDSPFSVEDFQVFPYPEVGIDLRVGYRQYVEGGLKGSVSWFTYAGMEGGTYTVELFVTVYPIPYIGIELGYRYLLYDLHSKSDDPNEDYDFELEYSGFTGSVHLRF